MDPHEILPTPEKEQPPQSPEAVDGVQEKSGAQSTEQKKTPAQSGFGAVSAVAVDDAQGQLQGVIGDDDDYATSGTVTPSTIDVPEEAEDLDLIEKIWVQKAKDIVQATEGDPHKQNDELSKMKVEYVKKRFNKELKAKES